MIRCLTTDDESPLIRSRMLALLCLYQKDSYYIVLKVLEESNNLRKQ